MPWCASRQYSPFPKARRAVGVMIVGGKFVQQPGFRMFSATKALIWSYNMGLGVGAVP